MVCRVTPATYTSVVIEKEKSTTSFGKQSDMHLYFGNTSR